METQKMVALSWKSNSVLLRNRLDFASGDIRRLIESSVAGKIITFLLSIVGVLGIAYWIGMSLVRSEHPRWLAVKYGLTPFIVWGCLEIRAEGGVVQLAIIPFALILALMWAGEIGGWVGRKAGAMYDGGDLEVEKQAFLSRVDGHRTAGEYQEALALAQKESEENPNDYDCRMLIATIHAEDLKDLRSAAAVVRTLVDREGLKRKQVTYALNSLADWQLQVDRDPDAARMTLHKIIQRFPETRAAQSAESRMAHLPTREDLAAADRPSEGIVMPEFERDLGLKGKKLTLPVKEEIDPAILTEQYLTHLKTYPNDWDTREKLATHYVEKYELLQGLQEAANQMEILISSKLANKAEKCRWIHQLADWQAKIGRDPDGARETLSRIIEMYPGSAQASEAERAIQYIRG